MPACALHASLASGIHAAALHPAGFLAGKKATAHPAFSDRLADQSAVPQRVVVDGRLTTSRGPGTAFEFALALVKQLYGEEKMREVAGPMVRIRRGGALRACGAREGMAPRAACRRGSRMVLRASSQCCTEAPLLWMQVMYDGFDKAL